MDRIFGLMFTNFSASVDLELTWLGSNFKGWVLFEAAISIVGKAKLLRHEADLYSNVKK